MGIKTDSEIVRRDYYEILAKEKAAMANVERKPELEWECLKKGLDAKKDLI